MEKLHLKNDTYQVWDRGTLWFQGTEQECDNYIIVETSELTEIPKIPELSDEEIEKAFTIGTNQKTEYTHKIQGAKWYREQLKSKQ